MASGRPLKGLVDISGCFKHLPPLAILGIGLLTSVVSGVVWSNVWVGVVFGLFGLADWLMLAALPRFDRSYGPPQLPWLSLSVMRTALALPAALLPWAWALPVVVLAQLGLAATATYACWIEPTRLSVTYFTLQSPCFNGCPPLRLLHVSDLHIERITEREKYLLSLVDELAPDVIVVTGDFLNISFTFDPTAQRQARGLLSQFKAPGGVFAIKGSPSVDPPEVLARLLDGLDIIWLRDEMLPLTWHSCRLQIAGVECSYDIEDDEERLCGVLDGRVEETFTLLLYHTPDVMPAAAAAGVDLYLAGHTHGGQLRLPFYGALATGSIHGKRYEMGRYREQSTTLYVNRGVGLEGKGAPRARFLCPPEIALFTIVGSDG